VPSLVFIVTYPVGVNIVSVYVPNLTNPVPLGVSARSMSVSVPCADNIGALDAMLPVTCKKFTALVVLDT
jgi:hypothetical protein